MASSSSSRKRKYDVFLSFRGEDTRPNILSHIRRCLDNRNIVNFKDDEMKRGEEIGPSLLDAIESSTIALVIFSKRYASSRWCLDELVHILECKEKHGLKVFPIFFHVDPFHVREPRTRVFADDFAKHKEKYDNLVVEKWISAMTRIGKFGGYTLGNGTEVDLLDKVIEVILQNVEPLPSINAKELVGIGTHVRKLESLMGDDTQCFIGITGMGGVGKTTIARLIFDIFRGNFEGAIFLSVAEVLGRSDEGNIDLTKTFLSALMEKEVIFSSPFVRHSPHARWLFNKKLLVVLDDVKFEQFQNLIGEFCSKGDNGTYHHQFGSGTKIILTSRNKQLLRQICSNGDKSIYEVRVLGYSDALKLFCGHAFGQNYPKEEFENLVRPFIGYAGGNPLALKVLGSLLRGKTKEEWESFLKILGKNQDQDIYEILKISYDGLDENQKSVFLHIACYFVDVSSSTIDMLDSCGWGATYGIRVLEDKCLLERSVQFDGRYFMHNLLTEMGKQIVKQESKDPGKRLILWEPRDVRLVFSRTSVPYTVEGIKLLSCYMKEQIVLNPNDFAKVPCLKFLTFWGGHVPHGLDYLPNELRLIDWTYYPLKSLPAQFQPTNLFELNLRFSNLEYLWEGRKDLRSLQSVDLSFSGRLKKLPDLSCAPNLKIINLNYCNSLVELSSSMKHLHKLQSLSLRECKNIRSLPSCIWKLNSLEGLSLVGCSKLETLSESMEFPDPSTSQLEIYEQLSPLKLLYISGCGKIRFLPELSGKLLQKIDASNCESLETSFFDLKQLFRFECTLENLDDYYINNIFSFTNCWKLDVRWVDFAELAKKKIQATTVLWYFKTDCDPRYSHDCCYFYMGYPGCEIPKWIKHQNMGYSITLQIPVNERLLGFAISAVFSPCEIFDDLEFFVYFNFKNSSGNFFNWEPLVPNPLFSRNSDTLTRVENTIIYGIPLPANYYNEMIEKLGTAVDYEITLHISYCSCCIKRPEDLKCGMIPLFVQNANGKRLETPLDETTKIIIKDINDNLEVFVDDYMVKNPDRKTISKMYKEVTINNPEVNHQGILYCIWGNENCRKSNEMETFSWLNEGYGEYESEDDNHTPKCGHETDKSILNLNHGEGLSSEFQASSTNKNGDAQNLGDVELRTIEESETWKLTEINEPSQCWSLRLPDGLKVPKISRLVYANSGCAILALASNTIHLLWKLRPDYCHLSGQESAIPPKIWKPTRDIWMINEIADTNLAESVSCFTLVEGDSYLLSASGGKISIFNMKTLKKMKTLMSPPPVATYLTFHPQDHNIIAVGMDDYTILIYNILTDKVISQLKGHFGRVTGLAFSHKLNVLVSSGADAQLFVWSSGEWEKQKSGFLVVPASRITTAQSDTNVQFHVDQIHILVVHKTQLAIYETRTLQCVKHWVPCESSALISHATFSCDSQLVYACFLDATVCVFRTANLSICSRIHPLSYLTANVSEVQPVVIAAHPLESNQFALGLSDGGVYILQPLESVGTWDVPAHVENEPASCELISPLLGPSGLDQAQTDNFLDDILCKLRRLHI